MAVTNHVLYQILNGIMSDLGNGLKRFGAMPLLKLNELAMLLLALCISKDIYISNL